MATQPVAQQQNNPEEKKWKHCIPTIGYLLSLSPKDFKLCYPKETEINRRALVAMQSEGFTSIPCSNSDEHGECLGHTEEEARS